MVLDLDYDKASCSIGERGSSPLQSTSRGNHASSSRTQKAGPKSLLPRVADLIIREAPDKLNLRFEELSSVMLGQSSADSGPPRTMAQLMLAHKKVC